MKKYKNHIIGVIILLVGFGVGWMLKPSQASVDTQDHSEHSTDMSGDVESAGDEIWTCSMHPQIRQNEPGLCPICEMDLIPLDDSFSNDDPTVLQMSLEATKLAQIETT
ncbi:MAG: efflux RND transporter periplasmic adaptor subunit, partial [Bacteroidia bacterium]|nr:efflux RND transporter periplasmic adaptor subunit [Bacteroidia bacterium]